jgi:hypothetical protein
VTVVAEARGESADRVAPSTGSEGRRCEAQGVARQSSRGRSPGFGASLTSRRCYAPALGAGGVWCAE